MTLTAIMTTAALILIAPAATGSTASHRPLHASSYLLALGDSISFGFQSPKLTDPPNPAAFDTGYVDVLAGRSPQLDVTNYSCPGESLTTFIGDGCPWRQAGFALHDQYDGSQLAAAVSFLRAHRSQPGIVTLAIWGNDILALRTACGDDMAWVFERTPAAIAAFADRLRTNHPDRLAGRRPLRHDRGPDTHPRLSAAHARDRWPVHRVEHRDRRHRQDPPRRYRRRQSGFQPIRRRRPGRRDLQLHPDLRHQRGLRASIRRRIPSNRRRVRHGDPVLTAESLTRCGQTFRRSLKRRFQAPNFCSRYQTITAPAPTQDRGRRRCRSIRPG